MTSTHRVIVWKSALLNASETFIRNQTNALRRYSPILVGTTKVNSPISEPSDQILYGARTPERLAARIFHQAAYGPRVQRSIRSLSPALIHAHFAPEAFMVGPIARRLGIPLIVTVHGRDVTAQLDGYSWRAIIRRRRVRLAFRAADKVIAVSEFIAKRSIAMGASPDKLAVHHIGIPIPNQLRSLKRWDILFVGRLVEKKGVLDLIRAIDALKDLRPTVAFVGDGPLRTELETLARRLDIDARFLGTLSPEAVRHELNSARIFAAPSKHGPDGDAEGLGMVFIEAAAAGLPVVAYRHGGVPEAVLDGVTGLLAPEGDVAALATNLRRLLESKELQDELGSAGRTRIEREFDITNQTRRLEEIYDEVVRNSEEGKAGAADR